MFGLSDKHLEEIIAVISSFAEVNESLIFGSRAIGNFKKGSDVDIVIKG